MKSNNSGQYQSSFSRKQFFGNNQKHIGYFRCNGNFNINSQCSGNNLYRLNKPISSPIVYFQNNYHSPKPNYHGFKLND